MRNFRSCVFMDAIANSVLNVDQRARVKNQKRKCARPFFFRIGRVRCRARGGGPRNLQAPCKRWRARVARLAFSPRGNPENKRTIRARCSGRTQVQNVRSCRRTGPTDGQRGRLRFGLNVTPSGHRLCAAASETMIFAGSRSLRLDVGGPDHFRPLLSLVGYELPEVSRRAG